MKDNKSWYEKISIWITIIAGICAILGISVFGSKALFKDTKAKDTNITLENNEINTGNQSPVVIGDNNTFNFGITDPNSISNNESDKLSMLETEDFSVTTSYDMNTPQTASDGVNVLIEAETSFPAEHVTISGISDNFELEPKNMHGGLYKWQFVATFYIKGTYTITVTAYDSDGKSVSDEFTYVY